MPKTGHTVEFDQRIEDYIAQMLAGRTSLIAIESIFLANLRQGNLTTEEHTMLSNDLSAARTAIEIGLRCGRWIRNPPPELLIKRNPKLAEE